MDKPAGPTSHDVVARVRREFRTRAVGHTGTLDPFATGLLVILLGRATRLARFVEQQSKTYLATARLGTATTTDDLTGEALGDWAIGRFGDSASDLGQAEEGGPANESPNRPIAESPRRQVVEAALAGFLGPQRQRPPAYSAKRTGGERSYQKARRGETVTLPEVDVIVHAIDLLDYEYPEVRFRVTVSAGTYVRALARDLGQQLGTGAHLAALRREAIGGLLVQDAIPLQALDGATPLLPPLAVLGHLPQVPVTDEQARDLGFGRVTTAGASPTGVVAVAVAPDQRLVAVGTCRDDGFHPDVVLESTA